MRNSLSTRAARACFTGALVLSLAFTPTVAHMATPPARTGIGAGHFAAHGFRGFTRIGADRFGFNRFRFDRFDNHRFDFDRFGFDRFGYNRFGRNANALDFGLLGLDGWGYWGYPPSYPTAPAAPIIIGAGGPPVSINVYAGGGSGAGDPAAAGGGTCPVLHLLNYDKAGRYVGERQVPAC